MLYEIVRKKLQGVSIRARWRAGRTSPAFDVSGRRVSRLLAVPVAALRYQSRQNPQMELGIRLREPSAIRVCFGYRKPTIPLKLEGRAVKEKRLKNAQVKPGAWSEDHGRVPPPVASADHST